MGAPLTATFPVTDAPFECLLARALSKVVLPLPEGPRIAQHSPGHLVSFLSTFSPVKVYMLNDPQEEASLLPDVRDTYQPQQDRQRRSICVWFLCLRYSGRRLSDLSKICHGQRYCREIWRRPSLAQDP